MTESPTRTTTTPAGWGSALSKTVTWHDPLRTALAGFELPGLDYLAAIRDGKLPPPPISQLFEMELTSLAEGDVTFRCTPDSSAYNPIGMVHGGLVCTLLDSVCGCAVHTTLPARVGYTSIEIKVSFLRPAKAGDALVAHGWVTKVGSRVGFAEADVRNQDGKVVASASSSLLIMR